MLKAKYKKINVKILREGRRGMDGMFRRVVPEIIDYCIDDMQWEHWIHGMKLHDIHVIKKVTGRVVFTSPLRTWRCKGSEVHDDTRQWSLRKKYHEVWKKRVAGWGYDEYDDWWASYLMEYVYI